MTSPHLTRTRAAALAGVLLAGAAIALTAQFGAAQPANDRGLYIVQMSGAPVSTYTGGVAGIGATQPKDGAKLDSKSRDAVAYRTHLRSRHDLSLRRAGLTTDRKVRDYDVAFNGFAARLTSTEADRISRTAGVVRVWKNELRHGDTRTTADFLGLTGPGGVWADQFRGAGRAGEGVIIGDIDSGFWPENPSFSALPEPRPDAATIAAKWRGSCDTGNETAANRKVACNNKVIGARWFGASGLDTFPGEFQSPRDYDGHGSHTASTAAGNVNTDAVINGVSIGAITGIAPAARLAVYKALWQQEDGTTVGGTVDLVSAVDQAVADGVDIINYSISGSTAAIADPVELAFLNATAAGVFVAASAGNSGPTASTVNHNSPWVTTVGASTADRTWEKKLTLGNGKTYRGIGVGAAVPSAPLVDAAKIPATGVDADDAALCGEGTLNKAKAAGRIVLCARGVVDRTEKSQTVKAAGGVGMVLYNTSPNSLNADFHAIPTIHVDETVGEKIKLYLANPSKNPTVAFAPVTPTAKLSAGTQVRAEAPAMATFSSLGPAVAGDGNLLKPDITAPGVDVVAAVAPPGNHGNNFDAYSGTSMSSPHIAGVAALIRSAHPTWKPMWIKSALMTTAGQKDNDGRPIQRDGVNATPLDYGAGHVQPARAFDPGLVYDVAPVQMLQYTCGIGERVYFADGSDACAVVGTLSPTDLNYPSLAIGALPGKQTVTRAVTNVTDQRGRYDVSVQAPKGFSVKVSPAHLSIAPGATATFSVTVSRTSADFDAWSFGSYTWSDGRGHAVRSPIGVRAVPLQVVDDVAAPAGKSSITVAMTAGFAGNLKAVPYGLTAATTSTLALTGTQTDFDATDPATGPAVKAVSIQVPADAAAARVTTYAADYGAGADIDLFAYRTGDDPAEGAFALSAGSTAGESIDLPAGGDYTVYVVQYATPTGVTSQRVKVDHWVVPPTAAGNLTATPATQPVSLGKAASVTASWSGLVAGRHYLGVLEYRQGSEPVGQTTLSVTG